MKASCKNADVRRKRDELRRRKTDLLIDSCASGGKRNDLETMRRAVPLWISDNPGDITGREESSSRRWRKFPREWRRSWASGSKGGDGDYDVTTYTADGKTFAGRRYGYAKLARP